MAKARTGSIRQRGASFTVTVDTGQRDDAGKRIRINRTSRGTRGDAEAALRALLVDLERQQVATTRDTVSALIESWLKTKSKKKWATLERYRGISRLHIEPFIGSKSIATFGRRDVREFYARLEEAGRSPQTRRLVHAVLSGAFKVAVDDDDGLLRNPFERQGPPQPAKEEVKIPAESQVEDMLELAREIEHPLFAAIWLAAHTGMRRGEIIGLQWTHIDPVEKYIEVKQTLGYSHVEHKAILDTPKTKKSVRPVYLDSETVDVLMAHKGVQEAHREAMGSAYTYEGIVFANVTGGWYFPASLSNAVTALSGRVGLPFELKALRHYHASMMLKYSKDVLMVARRLGHSSTKMTLDTYGHVLPNAQQEAVEAMATRKATKAGKEAISSVEWAESTELVIPHVFGDHRAGEDLIGVSHQVFQETALLGGEVYGRTLARHLPGRGIQPQVPDVHLAAQDGGLTAGQYSKACQQLGEGEGFHQVVVGAAVQSQDPIFDGVPGCEHQDRRGQPPGSQRAANLDTVPAGKHHVQDYQVEGCDVVPCDGLFAIGSEVDGVALFRKAADDEVRDRGVVFYQQYTHRNIA